MKRYVMSMDMFIYAESDEKAKELAQYIANQQQKKWDNQANISSLKELNFGKIIPGQELI